MIKKRRIESPNSLPAQGGYSQAIEISDFDRVLFISGQIPVEMNNSVPKEFSTQCNLVWEHINAQLEAANMTYENIIKVTTFLSDRKYAEENSKIRRERLGENKPALTVVICDIYDKSWLLEIEAIAAS